MIEIRPLYPRPWEPSEPLVAYNNHDNRVVSAGSMVRGNGSYYDLYGYRGSQDIVCIDCKEDGRDVPVILVQAAKRRIHFRHKQGEAPDGMGRHGETAEHLRGKKLIVDWALDQPYVLEPSVEEEVWVPGIRLRSDVTATLISGRQLAFEVQRKPLDWKDWDRRHGGYKYGGVRDLWLWSPDVPDLVLDLPLTSVVLDMEDDSLGILVAKYPNGYRHPTAEPLLKRPTHYACAPLSDWSVTASGTLAPPEGFATYIGEKHERARLAQLTAHREAFAPARPPEHPLPQQVSPSACRGPASEAEQQRIKEAIARIFAR